MNRIRFAKEAMELAAVVLVLSAVAALLSSLVWVWVAILFWPQLPIANALLWTFVVVWFAGFSYGILDLLDSHT